MSDEDELRTSVLWPYQVRSSSERQQFRLDVYAARYALTHAPAAPTRGTNALGRRGALSVPTWVNRILAAACIRSAWKLGGVEAAAQVADRFLREEAQGDGA